MSKARVARIWRTKQSSCCGNNELIECVKHSETNISEIILCFRLFFSFELFCSLLDRALRQGRRLKSEEALHLLTTFGRQASEQERRGAEHSEVASSEHYTFFSYRFKKNIENFKYHLSNTHEHDHDHQQYVF